MSKKMRKRVNVVTIRVQQLEIVRENSFLYNSNGEKRKIGSPEDAFNLINHMYRGLDREVCVAAYLDTKNQPVAVSTISIGTLNASLMHPREILKAAILANCSSIILYHNHPSGVIDTPSKEDLTITERIKQACIIVGIDLMDHLIVYEDIFMSFKENGYL